MRWARLSAAAGSVAVMEGASGADEHHPARRWITDTFGTIDPFAMVQQQRQGRGWQPTSGRDGRSVVEEKVFIILQVALQGHGLADTDLDTLARATVSTVRSSPASAAAQEVEKMLGWWRLPPEQLAHLIRVVARVAADE